MNASTHTARHLDCAEHHAAQNINISEAERIASVAIGGGLALYGLTRGKLKGLLVSAIGGSLIYRGVTGHCSVYGALGIDTASDHPAVGVPAKRGFRLQKSITIDRPAEEVFNFWRKLENLPKIMDHLIEVRENGPKFSHWIAQGPFDRQFEWDAEIINERANELIAWRSVVGSQVDTAGSVHFTELPEGAGTRVDLSLKYDHPLDRLGIGQLFLGSIESRIDDDLRHFQRLMNSGEFASADSQAAPKS
ncbi:MAG TPA: YgaP-like transmembrane domain [Planctomycetaceae bacterium]|nr:YgaP-like transmembrane domain [Planctomycetaceae bacterium]